MIELLTEYLWKNGRVPFEWGSHDCGTFSARWIDERLGTDYRHALDTRITRDGLSKTLRSVRAPGGYRSLVVEMTNQSPLEDLEFDTGDIAVFIQTNGKETLGITSKRLVYAPGTCGVIAFDARSIMCYWSLECLKQ